MVGFGLTKASGEKSIARDDLDGVACAARIREDVAPRIAAFQQRHGRPPGLGVVLAGQNPASEVYVRNKIKTVGDAGCRAELFRLDGSATLDEALALVRRLNADEAIDGILVQSPLPDGHGRRRRAARVRRHRSGEGRGRVSPV